MITLSTQAEGSSQSRKQAVAEPSTSRIVPKPIPKSQEQDPRGYQLGQLRKRFNPTETAADNGATSLVFKLTPSDPDFPFELAHLDCDLRVPKKYPEERPKIKVRNKDIPRGFSINVERGWDKLATERKGATLLSLVNALDKNLEIFLSEEKVETVKLVAFKDTRHLTKAADPASAPSAPKAAAVQPTVQKAAKSVKPSKPYVPERTYTKEEVSNAQARRAQEIRQLEARMGRLPLFRRSADGVVFTIPIDPKRRADLPEGLRSVNNIHLIVPLLYPLQSLRVQLNDVAAKDAEPVEELFVEKAAEQKQMTLMSHVNYLAQNLHTLSKQAHSKPPPPVENSQVEKGTEGDAGEGASGQPGNVTGEKSHIHVIPRPPEWNTTQSDSDSEETSESDSADEGGASLGQYQQRGEESELQEVVERGTMMSFPSVELHGIEILQVSILNLTVKCERCRTENDLTGLKPGVEKAGSCKKCATNLSAKYNQQLVHEYSTRAGVIDLSGCKVSDMLPSTFVPTCGRCSTTGHGLVSVRGESMTNVCRECHGKFTFKIPEVKFLFITPGTAPPPTSGPRRKQEKLGLHAGEQLPNKGSCDHYRKSYRWFRFSCCNKVFPCDRCHDVAADHPLEWANRMICGWCSREQNYAVEVCGFCGRGVTGKRGHGFWEGGRGTRDQRMMSRKDPRKYKRIGTLPGVKKK
jgi:uncharacterized CHY-type Zn-finger protein